MGIRTEEIVRGAAGSTQNDALATVCNRRQNCVHERAPKHSQAVSGTALHACTQTSMTRLTSALT